MKKQLKYYFEYVENCNMCGESTKSHKILGRRLNASQGSNPGKKIGISTTVAKCNKCGLIYANPQPIPFDLQDHYGVSPEEYWKESYFNVGENYFQGEIKRLKSLIEYKEGMKALDIGAGIGKVMKVLEKSGFDTFGLEPSFQFYERAISKMGINPDKLKLGQIEYAEYPKNSFDFISFGVVLEHLYYPSEAITKALNWLKPGGIIHIEVPSSDWLINRILNTYYRMFGSGFISNLSPMHEPYHLYEFGLKSFQQHSQKNGYEIAFHEYYVCQTFMPKPIDYILKPFMKFTNTGMQLCVWLRKKKP